MAEIVPQQSTLPEPSTPRAIPPSSIRINPPKLQDTSGDALRNGHLGLDVFSPVNQNGSFEFDRVIKAGQAQKRTRRTKVWKPIYLVLRPNLLSIYRSPDEVGLRHQITLSELTAIARQKDPKKRAKHVFGLFSPSRNFHLSASSESEAQEWVGLIRREARIDEEEEEMILTSPNGGKNAYSGFGRHNASGVGAGKEKSMLEKTESGGGGGFSSSEAEHDLPPRESASSHAQHPNISQDMMHSAAGGRRPSHNLSYSGNERGSFSDFSDTGPGGLPDTFSALSLGMPNNRDGTTSVPNNEVYNPNGASKATGKRNVSQMSSINQAGDERVLCQGFLYVLKSKGGVRQWKKLWVVLRPKNIAFYKNQEEYSASLILPFSNILNAVDIDPVSKTKRYCMQLISEERTYRFCAESEDDLARWLGALKSLLSKRKEAEMQRKVATEIETEKGKGTRNAEGIGPSTGSAATQ